MLQQCEPWPLWDVHWVMMFPAVANSGQDRDSVSRKNSRISSVSSRNLQPGLVSAAVLDPGCITFFAHLRV